MSEWISVEDRLPEEGIDVLTGWRGRNTRGWIMMTDFVEGGEFCGDIVGPPATHWMPLPDPPETDND